MTTPIERAVDAAEAYAFEQTGHDLGFKYRDGIIRAALTAALDHPDLAPMIRDWRMSTCEHYRGTDICSPCLRDLLKEWMLDG